MTKPTGRPPRALPPVPLYVGGRTFVAWDRAPHNRVTLHNLSEDDVCFLLHKLGQYVEGTHPYATFRAYVAEVTGVFEDRPGHALILLEGVKTHA